MCHEKPLQQQADGTKQPQMDHGVDSGYVFATARSSKGARVLGLKATTKWFKGYGGLDKDASHWIPFGTNMEFVLNVTAAADAAAGLQPGQVASRAASAQAAQQIAAQALEALGALVEEGKVETGAEFTAELRESLREQGVTQPPAHIKMLEAPRVAYAPKLLYAPKKVPVDKSGGVGLGNEAGEGVGERVGEGVGTSKSWMRPIKMKTKMSRADVLAKLAKARNGGGDNGGRRRQGQGGHAAKHAAAIGVWSGTQFRGAKASATDSAKSGADSRSGLLKARVGGGTNLKVMTGGQKAALKGGASGAPKSISAGQSQQQQKRSSKVRSKSLHASASDSAGASSAGATAAAPVSASLRPTGTVYSIGDEDVSIADLFPALMTLTLLLIAVVVSMTGQYTSCTGQYVGDTSGTTSTDDGTGVAADAKETSSAADGSGGEYGAVTAGGNSHDRHNAVAPEEGSV
jgi:hypothetical protein